MSLKLVTLLLSLVATAGLLFAQPAYAFDPVKNVCRSKPNASVCKDNTGANTLTGPDGIVTKVVKIIALVTGIAAVIMIIISGIRFVTSGGDAQKVAGARNTILYAIVGLVVAVLAQVIIIFILSRL